MNESSKSIFHKLKDSRYATRYLIGHGVDIGAGADSLEIYSEFFPLMKSCRSWDIKDGDAQDMATISDSYFDFVHSSHCLEHLRDPLTALNNWLRILKPGGHLVCLLPDEDLYEQGYFPSIFNSDHKHTFTIYKKKSWSNNSINLMELLSSVYHNIEILKIELLDATFRYGINKNGEKNILDQTTTPIGECAIEFVIRKSLR
jgi:SAM-dependent methyltransferase